MAQFGISGDPKVTDKCSYYIRGVPHVFFIVHAVKNNNRGSWFVFVVSVISIDKDVNVYLFLKYMI